MFTLTALIIVAISLNIAEAQGNPKYLLSPRREKNLLYNKPIVTECLKLRLFIIRRQTTNEKQLQVPLIGNRDRVPSGFQICDHSSESRIQPSGF